MANTNWDPTLFRPYISTADLCPPLPEANCKTAAQYLNLQLGGAGYPFSKDYGAENRGCYFYAPRADGSFHDDHYSKYEGMAFFGTGGTEAENKDEPVSKAVRDRHRLKVRRCEVNSGHQHHQCVRRVLAAGSAAAPTTQSQN